MKRFINIFGKSVAILLGLFFFISVNAQTLNGNVIYLDLSLGPVVINCSAKAFTGSVGVAGNKQSFAGQHFDPTKTVFHIYQSSTVSGSDWTLAKTGYATQADFEAGKNIRIPQYTAMTYGVKSWADYITNNSDVEAVAANWETAAAAVKRNSTNNYILIKGVSSDAPVNVVIDNIWTYYGDFPDYSTPHPYPYYSTSIQILTLQEDVTQPIDSPRVNLKMKGDNRVSNIYYSNDISCNGYLKLTSYEGDGKDSGSLTVALPPKKALNHDLNETSIIGVGQGQSKHSYNMYFNGGTVFAGVPKMKDNTYQTTSRPIINCIGARYATGVTINGGRLTAVSNSTAAAIGGGGGYVRAGGIADVTITDGEVYAYNHGVYALEYDSVIPCVAIGGGSGVEEKATEAEVTITGGYVYAQSVGGVAIGGGGSSQAKGGEGIVTISGGEVYAKSMSGKLGGKSVTAGASIGGGTGTSGGNATVNISGTDTKVVAGSVGGGKATAEDGNYGYANATVSGGDIQAQFVMEKGSSGNCTFTMTGGTIHDSKSTSTEYELIKKDGGALWIDDANGVVSITDGTIKNCTANNGGAIYQTGGSITLAGNALIERNNALEDGGALYVNGGELKFNSGEVNKNISNRNGGGAYVAGGQVTFNGNFNGNEALNGGGVFLASKASMTFKGGIISRNKAKATDSATAKTAYHGGNGIVEGCGGGIYLQSGTDTKVTTLNFVFNAGYNTFGLYSNEAAKGGDDIVSEGMHTSIVLPKVSKMSLIGFEGVEASPYWYQDYFRTDGDSTYGGYYKEKGHAVKGSVQTVDRFKNILDIPGTQYIEHRIPETDPDNPSVDWLAYIHDRYLCLTLSFNMIDITLKANNLLGKETALFKLIKHGLSNEKTYDILLNVVDGVASRTLKNMPWGLYSVIPNNQWNWAYEPLEPQENIRLGEISRYTFEFDMQHKNGALVPQHDERQPGTTSEP